MSQDKKERLEEMKILVKRVHVICNTMLMSCAELNDILDHVQGSIQFRDTYGTLLQLAVILEMITGSHKNGCAQLNIPKLELTLKEIKNNIKRDRPDILEALEESVGFRKVDRNEGKS